MKKSSILILGVFVLIAGFFSSCKKDSTTGTGPDISFTNGIDNATVQSGESWTVTGLITSDVGLDQVKYFKTVGGSKTQIDAAITSFTNKNEFNFTVSSGTVTANTTITVEATDKDNVTNSLVFTITVGAAGGQITSYTAKLLGASSNAAGSAFSTTTGLVYSKTDAATNNAKIDFIYFYSTTAGVLSEIISPSYGATNYTDFVTSSWTVKNSTKFYKTTAVSSADFDAMTNDSKITTAITGITWNTDERVVNLAVGDIFAFKTAAGKYGLTKVTALTSGVSGSITISVNVQQ
jgi:hypothetical protein